jgi:predicted  nucleic acid-binding Zn-ribbon protein
MKKSQTRSSAFKLAIITILSTSLFMGCNTTPKDKLDDATTEVVDASADLVKAQEDYMAEVEAFKASAETQIAANELKIKEYNADMKVKKTKELKAKVAELDKKTADLKKKLADFKADTGKETWSEFKTEFNHDMDGIGKSLNDLTIQNTNK